jgi:hypothetical protein
MPFDGMVSNNPKVDEMRLVVSVDKKRPPVSPRWLNDEVRFLMRRVRLVCLILLFIVVCCRKLMF